MGVSSSISFARSYSLMSSLKLKCDKKVSMRFASFSSLDGWLANGMGASPLVAL